MSFTAMLILILLGLYPKGSKGIILKKKISISIAKSIAIAIAIAIDIS